MTNPRTQILRTTLAALLLLAFAFPAASQDANNAAEVARLKQRVQTLEQQLSDLQILVGTLESMVRDSGGTRPPAPALAPQSNYGSGLGKYPPTPPATSNATPSNGIGAFGTNVQRYNPAQSQPYNAQRQQPTPAAPAQTYPTPARTYPPAPPVNPGADSFGAELPPLDDGNINFGGPEPMAAPKTAKSLYEQAYGQFLNNDYAGAQKQFAKFLKEYPKDTLAGNAQYWLGETYYKRGKYREAAAQYLKGYNGYKKGNKAPASLLKLAMSLKALKQIDAACTTFSELKTKYPNAPKQVHKQADQERKKAGC